MWEYIISGGIILLGVAIASYFLFRSLRESKHIVHYQSIIDTLTLRKLGKKKASTESEEDGHIKHYENIRDKLTLRKKTEEVEESSGGGLNIGGIIGGFIVIMVGVSLIGPISQQVTSASQTMNTTNPNSEFSQTILKTVPAIFAISILVIGVAIAFSALRNAGLIGGGTL